MNGVARGIGLHEDKDDDFCLFSFASLGLLNRLMLDDGIEGRQESDL